MTVNLIPQDELTLNLLAKVLAKMYRHSLSSKNGAPAEVAEPGTGASGTDLGDRRCRTGMMGTLDMIDWEIHGPLHDGSHLHRGVLAR